MPRTSETDGRPTRQRLLDVAATRFADRGYDATSFSDLVEASGLSCDAFYFHFDSKRDLALELFRDRQQRLQEAVMRRVDPQLPALDRFRQLWIERARHRRRPEPGVPAQGGVRAGRRSRPAR